MIAQCMHWEEMKYKNHILETAGSAVSKSQNIDHGCYWPLHMRELKTQCRNMGFISYNSVCHIFFCTLYGQFITTG